MWLLATTPQSVQEQVLLTAVPSPQPLPCSTLYILPSLKSTAFLCGALLQSFTGPGTCSRKLQSFMDPGSPCPLSRVSNKRKEFLNSEAVELSGCCLQTGLRVLPTGTSTVKSRHALGTEMRWSPSGKVIHWRPAPWRPAPPTLLREVERS